jgi:hypothetical protein
MTVKAFILAMAISLGFLILLVTAIRRRRLRDQAAVLWLAVSVIMVLCSLALPFSVLDRVAHLVGIAYGSDLLLLLAVIFLVVLVFNLSLNLAAVKETQTVLVQEIALMRVSGPGEAVGTRLGMGEASSHDRSTPHDEGDMQDTP